LTPGTGYRFKTRGGYLPAEMPYSTGAPPVVWFNDSAITGLTRTSGAAPAAEVASSAAGGTPDRARGRVARRAAKATVAQPEDEEVR
jgi:hypothetical protein